MERNLRTIFLLICLVTFALPALGHHSLSAEFDVDHSVKLTGMVTRVEWGNPHALLFVDVKSLPNGKVLTWALQLPSPNTFSRLGWTREPFRPGIVVIVSGHPAKDGSQKGLVQQVTSSDGRTLFASVTDPVVRTR